MRTLLLCGGTCNTVSLIRALKRRGMSIRTRAVECNTRRLDDGTETYHELDPLAVGEAERHVVVENGVHVFDPQRVNRAIEHRPPARKHTRKLGVPCVPCVCVAPNVP